MTGADTPNAILVRKLGSLSKVVVQNRLMRVSDREIALSMMYMEDADRGRIFSILAPKKVVRIREELALISRLRVTYEQYSKAISSVTSVVEGEARETGLKSHIRPMPKGRRGLS